MGDRGYMRFDPLQVREDVEVNGAAFDRLGDSQVKSMKMRSPERPFSLVQPPFISDDRFRSFQILGFECGNGEGEIVRNRLMEFVQLPDAGIRKSDAGIDLLSGQVDEIDVDDVADILKVVDQ